MTTLATRPATFESSQQQLIEHYWNLALQQLNHGSMEVNLPASMTSQIGTHGINIIADRLAAASKGHATIFHDPATQIITMMPSRSFSVPGSGPALTTSIDQETPTTVNSQVMASSPSVSAESTTVFSPDHASSRAATNARAKVAKDRLAKVPRPPNAFILYRQYHHPLVKQEHPAMHNNQISVMIGKKWKTEDDLTKASFKKRAEDLKRQHSADHPQYQYQPRKPSEKKRRMTKRKAAKLAAPTPKAPTKNGSTRTSTTSNGTARHQALQHVPEFPVTDDGLDIDYTFFPDQIELFEKMIVEHNKHNTVPMVEDATNVDQSLHSTDVTDDKLFYESLIDFEKLEEVTFAQMNERDAAFAAEFPDYDSLGLPVFETEENYNNMLGQWTENETKRMIELEKQFGDGGLGALHTNSTQTINSANFFNVSDAADLTVTDASTTNFDIFGDFDFTAADLPSDV